MRNAWCLVFCAAVAVAGPSADARDATRGASLWTGCTADFFAPTYYESYAACRAYVLGVADVLTTGNDIDGIRACMPDKATKADITEAVIAWLDANPGERHSSAAHVLVARALQRKYPCS